MRILSPLINRKRIRIALILLALTLFFFIDELLMVFLLDESEVIEHFGPAYLTLMALGMFVSAGLALVAYRALRRRPVTGKEGLLGKRGVVLSGRRGEGKVRVHGEIWEADFQTRLRPGQRVLVSGVSGMRLQVAPDSEDGFTGL